MQKNKYPIILPITFKIISSTSNIPTLEINWIVSTDNENSKDIKKTFKNFLFFILIIGSIKPNGAKANILPNIFTRKLSSPNSFLYLIKRFISLNGVKLYLNSLTLISRP